MGLLIHTFAKVFPQTAEKPYTESLVLSGVGMSQTINFSNLTVQISEEPNRVSYSFKGEVDENFRQLDIPRIQKPEIILELEGVENFNSCGIREWIFFIRDLSEMGPIVFRNCSVAVVDQINLVPDSIGNGHIESIFAPYYCESHGEVNRLIEVAQHIDELAKHHAPDFNCDQCGGALQFDALEESYFMFVGGALPEVG